MTSLSFAAASQADTTELDVQAYIKKAAESDDSLRRWQAKKAKGNPKLESQLAHRMAAEEQKEKHRAEQEAQWEAEARLKQQKREQQLREQQQRRSINREISYYLSEPDKATRPRATPAPPVVLSPHAEQELERRILALPPWPEMEQTVAGQSQRFRFKALSLSQTQFKFHDPAKLVEQMILIFDKPIGKRRSKNGSPQQIITNRDSSFEALLLHCCANSQYRDRCISKQKLIDFAVETCFGSGLMHDTVFYEHYKKAPHTQTQRVQLELGMEVVVENSSNGSTRNHCGTVRGAE